MSAQFVREILAADHRSRHQRTFPLDNASDPREHFANASFTTSLEVFMGEVLIRGFDDTDTERLRRRAERHHRSLEDELRENLEQASQQVDIATARDLADRIRRRLEGGPHSDSAELIREDRDR
jgi:plasmid stability protein